MPEQTLVTVYRTRSCPFCVMAAKLLDQINAAVEEVFLDDHPDRSGFTHGILPGHYTVPLILVGDRPIGGFSELRRMQESGDLQGLLRGAG